VGLLVGLAVLVSNGVTDGSMPVTGGHGMCCGVWPLDGMGELWGGGIRSIFRFYWEEKSTIYRSGCQRDLHWKLVLRDRTCRWCEEVPFKLRKAVDAFGLFVGAMSFAIAKSPQSVTVDEHWMEKFLLPT
jgi:hypothetical protein